MSKILFLSILFWAANGCPDQLYCSRCGKPGKNYGCQICHGGYLSVGGTCVLVGRVGGTPHCVRYHRPDARGVAACAECQPGYGLRQDSDDGLPRCSPCQVPGCQLCSDWSRCEACKDLTRLLKPTAQHPGGCSGLKIALPDCLWAVEIGDSGDYSCRRCRPGYAIVTRKGQDRNGLSYCAQTSIANCLYLDRKNLSRCQECEAGFTIVHDGTCKAHDQLFGWFASREFIEINDDASNLQEKLQTRDLKRRTEGEKNELPKRLPFEAIVLGEPMDEPEWFQYLGRARWGALAGAGVLVVGAIAFCSCFVRKPSQVYF